MVIINADDWGKTRRDTDAALACFERGRITSVSAMVFMEDSARAAAIAIDKGIDAGLHLNFTERFTAPPPSRELMIRHERVARCLTANRYSFLLYRPGLTSDLHYIYRAQFEEFAKLYGRPPAHIDGHHHQHLCTNMLVDGIIAKGTKVRRSFISGRAIRAGRTAFTGAWSIACSREITW